MPSSLADGMDGQGKRHGPGPVRACSLPPGIRTATSGKTQFFLSGPPRAMWAYLGRLLLAPGEKEAQYTEGRQRSPQALFCIFGRGAKAAAAAPSDRFPQCPASFGVLATSGASGAGDEVIMSIAGHVSRAMLSRYSHVRMEAKRRALDVSLSPDEQLFSHLKV